MALSQVANLAFAIAILGILSFGFGIVAENKKPASGLPVQQGDTIECTYPTDLYVPLGILSIILLAALSVLGVVSIVFPYGNKAVPIAALLKSKMLVVFSIVASVLFFVSEALMLWAVMVEHQHLTHLVHTTAHCPTAKTGLMGGAAFLALDTMLFWLVCQMLTMNAREDHLEVDEEDEKLGSYGVVAGYAGITGHPATI